MRSASAPKPKIKIIKENMIEKKKISVKEDCVVLDA